MLTGDLDFSMNTTTHDLTGITVTHSKFLNDVTFGTSFNATSTSLLGLELKSSKETDDLSEVFFEILQTSSSLDVLDTIGRFTQCCCDSLEKISPWQRFTRKNMWLVEEADTWRLLYCLYLDSLQKNDDLPLKEHEKLCPKKLIGTLFKSDSELRTMQLVVDWLENCASYQDKAIPSVSHGGGTIHWENTLHHLENGASLFDSESGNRFVTKLDPDAARRQKKSLHPLDKEDDEKLSRSVFKELRCGRFEEAVSLCTKAGQMWRAIILRGHILLDYPEPPQHDTKLSMVGNQCRELWKWSCLSLVNETDENSYFKATLGVLCGHLAPVLSVCSSSWEDLLWAHLRVQIEARVDHFFAEHHSTAHLFESQQNLPEPFEQATEMSIHRIFGCVNALHKDKSETQYQEMQRHLILDEINSMLQRVAVWLSSANFDLIRFLAHLVLVLRRIGRDNVHEISNDILKVYVEKLIENIDGSTISPELIAYYASTLPVKHQIQKYSELMWLVEAKDDRIRVMDAGKRAGIDVEAAAKETVHNGIKVLKGFSLASENNDVTITENIDDKEQKMVHRVAGCLEWLSFYPTQIALAIQMSNSIIRTLIFKGDVDSATGVLSRIVQYYPPNAISDHQTSSSNAFREHMCLKAYLEAVNGYATWYRQHVGGRPKSPQPLKSNVSFTEKAQYEQLKAQATLQQDRWTMAGMHQARHTKQLLYNVLLFPNGWMVDDVLTEDNASDNVSDESSDREKELLALRKLCIPETVLLLLKVLQSGDVDSHLEAVRLSEIIASEKYKLYKLFPKHNLREVLHKITDSSLYMLEKNKDPWGFETYE